MPSVEKDSSCNYNNAESKWDRFNGIAILTTVRFDRKIVEFCDFF